MQQFIVIIKLFKHVLLRRVLLIQLILQLLHLIGKESVQTLGSILQLLKFLFHGFVIGLGINLLDEVVSELVDLRSGLIQEGVLLDLLLEVGALEDDLTELRLCHQVLYFVLDCSELV